MKLKPHQMSHVLSRPNSRQRQQVSVAVTAARHFEPMVEEGPADRAALPRARRVWRLDARAGRVGRQRDGQEAPDRRLVAWELQDPRYGLKAAERVHQAMILAGAIQWHPHSEPAMPAFDCVNSVLEY